MSRSCRRAREREQTAVTLEGVQILQEGTLEGVQILQEGTGVRKIAQLQLQRMQVLRCQEFEPSFFAESQGLEVQTDRPRSKQIDRQPSTAFARTILAPATPSAAQTNAPGALACLPASASSTPLYAHT